MDPKDATLQNVLQEATQVGQTAEEILRERIGDRKPTQEELSQAWETAAGADQHAYHQMMRRHGLYAPWSEIGDGWVPLVDELITNLKALGWNGSVEQVKEKYGGLRFYFNHVCYERREDASLPHGGEWVEVARTPDDADFDAMDRLVRAAEQASYRICEQCGAPGELRSTNPGGEGWYFMACEAHVDLNGVPGIPVGDQDQRE